MNITDAAYIAGFVDGEGTIGIVAHNKPSNIGGADRKTPHYRLVIGITNKDKKVLEWISSLCGGTIFEKSRRNSKWATAYELRITNREEAASFLNVVKPYLKIKSKQMSLAEDFLSLGLSKVTFEARGKTWPRRRQHPDDVEKKAQMKDQMNKLNLRGNINA